MARDYDRKCLDFLNKCGLIIPLFLVIFQDAAAQRVRVEPEVESYPGQMVNLRCQFVNGGDIRLTQVSWIWEPKEGQRENIAVYHPTFGESYPDSPQKGRVRFTHGSLENPSISISDLRMTDEGKYICEYATYPSGNEQGTTSLIMLAKPRNTVSPITVPAGTSPVVVARCESADGQPAAQISWRAAVEGDATTVSKPGVDNTVTVVSEFSMVPTSKDNSADISCVISHRTQDTDQVLPMKLSIEYPPTATIVGYDSNWYIGRTDAVLTCMATGNPEPTNITWKVASGPMPDTVLIRENTLTVLKVDDAVNTTFVCEVKNRLGASQDQITAVVTEPRVSSSNTGLVAGAVIGCLLVLLLIAVLIFVLVTHNRRQQRGYRGNSSQGVFGHKKASKNGTGGNNNGPIYTYRESAPGALAEKPNDLHGGSTPTAHDILLSTEMDEVERRKFDELEDEEEEERYDRFGVGGSRHHIGRHDDVGGYLDEYDMESQRDGSFISRTAVYV